MRTLFFALLITGLLIAGAGCKKDAACAFSFFISKSYTQTDVNGNIIESPNSSDWTYDGRWSACENSLFGFSDDYNYKGLFEWSVNVFR